MDILKKQPAVVCGLAISLVFLILALVRIDFFDALEYKFYDFRMGMRAEPQGADDIVIVDIDNDSVEKLGRWPWPRSLIAKSVEKINAGDPKIIGLNFIYSEAEENSGFRELKILTDIMEKQGETKSAIYRAMFEAMNRLDNDRKLEETIRAADKVVLPVYLKESSAASEQKKANTPEIIALAVKDVENADISGFPEGQDMIMPIPAFLKAAKGIGHVNIAYDSDGRVRRDRLLYRYSGLYIPSFALKLTALYLNLPQDSLRATLGESVQLGSAADISTTAKSELLINFKGPEGAFKRFSFFDVVNDKILPNVFKGKLVLVSPSAAGVMNPVSTPTASRMPIGELTANSIWSLLNKKFVRQPSWDKWAGIAMILLLSGVIAFVLPRLKAIVSGAAFALLLTVFIGGATYLFVSKGLWIQITYPVLQLIFGYLGVVTLNFFASETGKEKAEGESAETNRMLGLSFQTQGMLDMAFDKLRKVPVDAQMKDVLYNLGLDYERKRQFNKAASVYEYIAQHDAKFKDIGTRTKKLQQASETMVYGDGFLTGTTSGDPLLGTVSDVKPKLGRYEVLKQLGKGAMGIVYLGQDPRINRTTAIKTFKIGEGFEEAEAQVLKQKFFREAESAGTLSHPNIVTIYDAGEEHDLAYIAMEYLDGEDLQKYTKRVHLLPMRKVIEYVADIADGLEYAHQKGIVHRDIKPANVMLLKTGVVKITDFGIARITASSQTQTGIVKGTPHYMSPEQISGEKVDGRSDIFSLGVMLFQLASGDLPFKGDSPAALMHQIMNVPHPDPRSINPKILKPLATIIDKAMEKNREKRYQKAGQMAQHLRTLGKKIDELVSKKAGESE